MKFLPRFDRWWSRAPLFAAAILLPTAASADFLVVSQNALHLGQGSKGSPTYIADKNAFIRSLAHWSGNTLPQMTFLQEVMIQANEVDVKPAGGVARFSARKGNTSYLEKYADLFVNDAGGHLAVL